MPGPRNTKKQKKAQVKRAKQKKSAQKVGDKRPLPPPPGLSPPISNFEEPRVSATHSLGNTPTPPPNTPPSISKVSTISLDIPYQDVDSGYAYDINGRDEERHDSKFPPPKEPYIHDPGNGPRVKDMNAFLSSPFAAPPSLDDALCAEFAQEDLIDMLCHVLPEETALILWYNKSRLNARVCPACQRLYYLGDILPDHLPPSEDGAPPPSAKPVSSYVYHEQKISGICSPICFILAAFHYPSAITSTFGRMAEELSDEAWKLLDVPSPDPETNDMGLGMLIKMTRCHDLGLGQLLFPDLEPDNVEDYSDDQSIASEYGSDCSCHFDINNECSDEEEEEERGRRRTRD